MSLASPRRAALRASTQRKVIPCASHRHASPCHAPHPNATKGYVHRSASQRFAMPNIARLRFTTLRNSTKGYVQRTTTLHPATGRPAPQLNATKGYTLRTASHRFAVLRTAMPPDASLRNERLCPSQLSAPQLHATLRCAPHHFATQRHQTKETSHVRTIQAHRTAVPAAA